jgi:VIT1/CCC1 family predicted Fe2+/Mn2+ transporter
VKGADEQHGPVSTDAGMARERTDLAWNRSGLAVAVTVAVVLRRLWPLHGGKEVAALALIAAGAATWVVGMYLGGRMGGATVHRGALGESACRLLTIGTLALAVGGLIISVLS